MSKITLFEGASPGTPSSGQGEVYFSSSDKKLHVIDDAGLDTALGAGGGGAGLVDYLVDAGGGGTHTTIAAAIVDANTAYLGDGKVRVIGVKPDSYAEDLTFQPGVYLVTAGDSSRQPVPIRFSTAPLITGNHTFDHTNVSGIDGPAYGFRGIMFQRATSTTRGFDWPAPGAGDNGVCTFTDCHLADPPVVCTAEFFRARSGAAESGIWFRDCVMFLASNVPSFDIDGGSPAGTISSLWILNCPYIINTGGGGVINVANTSGFASPFEVNVGNSSIIGQLRLLDDCNLYIESALMRGYITNPSVAVGPSASARFTSCTFDTNATYDITGTGPIESSNSSYANGLDPALSIQYAAQVPIRSVSGTVQTASATPTTFNATANLMRVDTPTIGAASTINLPDPPSVPGQKFTVYDSGGAGDVNNITVATPSGIIRGQSTLVDKYQRIVFQSDGVNYIVVGNDSTP